jgi:hypothetical protein
VPEDPAVAAALKNIEVMEKKMAPLFEARRALRSKPRQRFARWVYRRLGGLP